MSADPRALDPADHRFSIAVVADTHVKPETGDESAPWPVNRLATARARWVAREIARYDPRLVVHLGDMVHPVPELPTFDAAVELMRAVFRQHHNRLHVVAGNHDVGDKPNPAMPAKTVRDAWVAAHERTFGPSWSCIDRDEVRVVLINSALLNSGSPLERRQRDWLEATLRSADGRRIFLFTHYPLFVLHPDEPSNYDNVDQPARADLLGLIREHRVEAVIAGHVHNVFYHRLDGTEFYVMPATAFVRQDYAEMNRVEAIHDNGRNDAEKLGFAIIDVYRRGHVVAFVPSYGRTLAADDDGAPVAPRVSPRCFPHPKTRGGAPLGVFLRHPWAEVVALPCNGPMDEFVRKQARNDYQVAALWRLGIRHARVPLSDLLDPTTRARVADLVAIGHRFTVFGLGVPTAALDTLDAHADLIDRYECVLPLDTVVREADALARFRERLGRPVLLSRVATSADDRKIGSRIELFVAHGFRPDQLHEIAAIRDRIAADGFVVRADLGADLVALGAQLAAWQRRHACRLDLHLRLAAHNPAENVRDDARILGAIVELYAVGLAHPDLSCVVDTLMDVDRGYFVRHGLIDRRCNLRPAGLAVEAMSALLGHDGGEASWTLAAFALPGGRALALRSAGRRAAVLLPGADAEIRLDDALATALGWRLDGARAVPLDAPWLLDPTLGTAAPTIPLPSAVAGPSLIVGAPPS